MIFTRFLADILAGAYEVEDLIPEDYERARDLCEQYADAPLGFVDAAVVAIAERLNERKIATLDHRHFRMVRPRHVDAFELLP
jgi:predicted nucleic acid-binding protein